MAMKQGNMFADLPAGRLPHEVVETLVSAKGLHIERIVSTGQATPEGEWLDQDRDEWVVLLHGGAALQFEGERDEIVMIPGDWIRIPARQRHRVARTAPGEPTVWLAAHYM
jgi:cupin 2 domain-containing protein